VRYAVPLLCCVLSTEGEAIVGTCQTVEKKYFRLTSAPKPETVRPLKVLQKALDLVKGRWLKASDPDRNGGAGPSSSELSEAYEWVSDQLRSIRLDLTVQHIRTPFTVHVYETHARIALEVDDTPEFVRCLTQLDGLYYGSAGDDAVPPVAAASAAASSAVAGHGDGNGNGSAGNGVGVGGHRLEFAAYKVIHSAVSAAKRDLGIVAFINHTLTEAERAHPTVQHALGVRSAILTDNYVSFFRLYRSAPNMSAYLMDAVAEKTRLRALHILLAAYRPKLQVCSRRPSHRTLSLTHCPVHWTEPLSRSLVISRVFAGVACVFVVGVRQRADVPIVP
jgi:SAC3 family protein LENG8/THP3